MAAYALVAPNSKTILPLPSSPSTLTVSSDDDKKEKQDKNEIHSSLSSVYSTYAKSYPNPSLAEERMIKKDLRRQIEFLNASVEAARAPPPKSLFGSLFGVNRLPPPQPTSDVEYYLQDVTNDKQEQEEEEESWLDWDCIPEEA
eukprot:3295800-Ditylum_brightwellii.AAC.1